ncbi:50S ribosomal protein L28 [Nocardiopsis sediminis]|uniref:Large ribosomal subunit protein bL28 n=1 Tax=Nocardiopsis sediminis TaxID=1778267 RepID=A0ABV8FKR2_9ACTN
MSRVCQVTGKRPATGNNVSHSHRRTKRRFEPNLQTRRYWLPSENRHVRLRISAKGMKVVDRRGIERVVADIRARGGKV